MLVDGIGESFSYSGYEYSFHFISDAAFTQLSEAQCVAAGYQAGCFAFATPKGTDYTVDFAFRLVAADVPEPDSLALQGLGLIGVAALRRRQQTKR